MRAVRPGVRARKVEIVDQYGKPYRCSDKRPAPVRATYDAARDSNQTLNIWSQATGRSAMAEATEAIRARIRNRARYEMRNNCYLRGMVMTRATYIVGRCVRLELMSGDEEADRRKQISYDSWAKEIRLGEKLRLAEMQMMVDGEVFLVFVVNERLRHPVKLDLLLVEPDRIKSQADKLRRKRYWEGIQYDENGNALTYDILDEHPGGVNILSGLSTLAFGGHTSKPADQVIHMYRRDRSSGKRGVSELTAALPLASQLRRMTLAVLTAAETAADFSWMLYAQDREAEPAEVDPMDAISLAYGSGLTLPVGWRMEQMKAEQPATTYKEFKREILNEMARCIVMPLNIALGDSSGYNFASGRLDHQSFFKDVEVQQFGLSLDLDTVYSRWNDFYQFTPNAVQPEGVAPGQVEPHQWHFDGHEHVDPVKEAKAQQIRIANLTTSLTREWNRQGLSLEQGLAELAREKKLLEKLDLLPSAEVVAQPAQAFIDQLAWVVADRVADTIAEHQIVPAA